MNKYYNRDSGIDNVDDDCVETFVKNNLNNEYETFGELYHETNKLQVKNFGLFKKRLGNNFRLKK